ncbi:hypothetical protein MRX96_027188 [Rhipicephalus microplus]
MSSNDAEGVRRYFTEQEWLKLPEYMKLRYGNIKENYDKMVALGLQPPIPEFMNAKPAARNCPAKSKSCGSSSRKVKRTSNDSQPGSKTTGKSPVRRSTRVQAKNSACLSRPVPNSLTHVPRYHLTLRLAGARANPPSVSRYPKRKLKNIKYTESEDPWDDENASRKAPTIAQVPRPDSKGSRQGAPRIQRLAVISTSLRICIPGRYGCYHDDPSECPVHGPSFYVVGVPLEDFELAKKSLPKGLVVLRSKIKGAQLGIFAVEPLPEGHCFGPYANSSAKQNVSHLSEEGTGERKLPPHCETAGETAGETTGEAQPETARWIRYVNCAPSELQCNVVVLQDDGFVYYQTCRPLEPSDELMVWCGRDKTGAPPPAVAVPSWRTAFHCDICGCTCLSKWQLDKHRNSTHPSAQFDSVNDNGRKGAKSFVCHVCRKAWSTKVALDRHIQCHTTVKPFRCEECAERFSSAVLLKRHMKRHTGALMYKCPHPIRAEFVERAFARKCHWSRHEIIMHGKR